MPYTKISTNHKFIICHFFREISTKQRYSYKTAYLMHIKSATHVVIQSFTIKHNARPICTQYALQHNTLHWMFNINIPTFNNDQITY